MIISVINFVNSYSNTRSGSSTLGSYIIPIEKDSSIMIISTRVVNFDLRVFRLNYIVMAGKQRNFRVIKILEVSLGKNRVVPMQTAEIATVLLCTMNFFDYFRMM